MSKRHWNDIDFGPKSIFKQGWNEVNMSFQHNLQGWDEVEIIDWNKVEKNYKWHIW